MFSHMYAVLYLSSLHFLDQNAFVLMTLTGKLLCILYNPARLPPQEAFSYAFPFSKAQVSSLLWAPTVTCAGLCLSTYHSTLTFPVLYTLIIIPIKKPSSPEATRFY